MKKKYKCFYCGRAYATKEESITCEKSHDLIPIVIDKTDLRHLVQFLEFNYDSRNVTLYGPSLIWYFKKCLKNNKKCSKIDRI